MRSLKNEKKYIAIDFAIITLATLGIETCMYLLLR